MRAVFSINSIRKIFINLANEIVLKIKTQFIGGKQAPAPRRRMVRTKYRLEDLQSRGIRAATMKQPPAASIESTAIVMARGLGSPSFAAARDHWSMIKPKVPTYICTPR